MIRNPRLRRYAVSVGDFLGERQAAELLECSLEVLAPALSRLYVDVDPAFAPVTPEAVEAREALLDIAATRRDFRRGRTTAIDLDSGDAEQRRLFARWAFSSPEALAAGPAGEVFDAVDGGCPAYFYLTDAQHAAVVAAARARSLHLPDGLLVAG